MRMITDTMYFGNYKFDVELDTGSETGANQLTIWVAEKLNIEPERARLLDRLEEEKRAFQHSFELEIAGLQGLFTVAGEKQGQKNPENLKRKARKIREQKKVALQRLEVEFARRELWPLDRRWFDPDTLQAQSHIYSEEYFLRDFYFEEANYPHIRNFCRKLPWMKRTGSRCSLGSTLGEAQRTLVAESARSDRRRCAALERAGLRVPGA